MKDTYAKIRLTQAEKELLKLNMSVSDYIKYCYLTAHQRVVLKEKVNISNLLIKNLKSSQAKSSRIFKDLEACIAANYRKNINFEQYHFWYIINQKWYCSKT